MKEFDKHNIVEPRFPKMDHGYSIPEGYFDSFGDRLLKRIAEEKPVRKSPRIIQMLKPAISIAAGLALLMSVYLHYSPKKPELMLADTDNITVTVTDDSGDQLSSTYSSLISEGQFFSALSEMDEYDSNRLSKDILVDYLATNCSDFEILNAGK